MGTLGILIYSINIFMSSFQLHSQYSPAGDQPKAIKELLDGLKNGATKETLL